VKNVLGRTDLNLQEQCKNISNKYKKLLEAAMVSYTDFIRTTEKRHENTVGHVWNRLIENDLIYKDKVEGWYSKNDRLFDGETDIKEITHPHSGKKLKGNHIPKEHRTINGTENHENDTQLTPDPLISSNNEHQKIVFPSIPGLYLYKNLLTQEQQNKLVDAIIHEGYFERPESNQAMCFGTLPPFIMRVVDIIENMPSIFPDEIKNRKPLFDQ
ncbi:14764_t:CDS:2, partial [Dentiscutata heterogama]